MAPFHLATALFARIDQYGDRTAIRYREKDLWQELSWKQHGRADPGCGPGSCLARRRAAGEGRHLLHQPPGVDHRRFCHPRPARRRRPDPCHEHAEAGRIHPGRGRNRHRLRRRPGSSTTGSAPSTAAPTACAGSSSSIRRWIWPEKRAPSISGISSKRAAGSSGADPIAERLKDASLDDLATLIYTSGTTGEPKGVMLHHATFHHAFVAHEERLAVSDQDVSLCFLPLSHVFERTWTFFALNEGMTIDYCDDTAKVVEYLQQSRPTIMCAVPRFYEKIYATVFEKLESAPPLKKKLFLWAIGVGWQAFLLRNEERPLPLLLHLRHKIAEALVLKKIQGAVGGRIRFFPCAGAPLSKKIEEFFHAAGIHHRLRLRPHRNLRHRHLPRAVPLPAGHRRKADPGGPDPDRRGRRDPGEGGNGHEGLLQKAGGDGRGLHGRRLVPDGRRGRHRGGLSFDHRPDQGPHEDLGRKIHRPAAASKR